MTVGEIGRRRVLFRGRGGARPARRWASEFYAIARPLELRTGVAAGTTVEHFVLLLTIIIF